MVFEQLANSILVLVDWGIAILVLMLIWEGIQWIRVGGEVQAGAATQYGKKSIGEVVRDFNKFTGRDKVQEGKKIKRDAAREKSRLLSEYIEEERELTLAKEAEEAFVKFKSDYSKSGNYNASGRKLKDSIDALETEVRRLMKTTFRQERQYHKLMNDIQKMGKPRDFMNAEALENSLLTEHKKVRDGVEELSQDVHKLPATLADKSATQTILQRMDIALDAVLKAQQQAYKDCEGIIALFEKLWK